MNFLHDCAGGWAAPSKFHADCETKSDVSGGPELQEFPFAQKPVSEETRVFDPVLTLRGVRWRRLPRSQCLHGFRLYVSLRYPVSRTGWGSPRNDSTAGRSMVACCCTYFRHFLGRFVSERSFWGHSGVAASRRLGRLPTSGCDVVPKWSSQLP